MARDWIKMRCDLRTNPKIVRISSILKSDRLRTVGALHAVWSIFDAHSTDGILPGYSLETIDEEIGWKGFCKALTAPGVEWIIQTEDGLKMPRFEAHNGDSAKHRAEDSERKRIARGHSNHGQKPDKHRTESGLENRDREELINTMVDLETSPVDKSENERIRERSKQPQAPAFACANVPGVETTKAEIEARKAIVPAPMPDNFGAALRRPLKASDGRGEIE